MPSKATLEASLARYSKSLATKQSSTRRSSTLVELDQWYRSDSLRKSIRDQGYSLDKDQLVQLMEWKLSRGKWRPSLSGYIASNSPTSVTSSTRLSSPSFPLSLASAKAFITQCSTLKGVGPATASAILSLFDPENEPFMSDQAMDYVSSRTDKDQGKKGKREYTMKTWENFRGEMQKRKEEEGWETMEELEMALLSYGIEREFGTGGDEAKEVGEEDKEEKKREKKAQAKSKKRKSDAREDEDEEPTETKPATRRKTRQSTREDS